MGTVHIGHIRNALNSRFAASIDMSDLSPKTPTDQRNNQFLTPSLAAFAIAELAEIDDRVAAAGVVDGDDDDGIDAFYLDANEHVCYLVQSNNSGSSNFNNATVLVRLISLEGCPPTFSKDLTNAANTQNRIEKKDFAALDPEQSRLQTELLLEVGKEYSFRSGDRIPLPDEGCTLDEAAEGPLHRDSRESICSAYDL
jgi:AIPR protein